MKIDVSTRCFFHRLIFIALALFLVLSQINGEIIGATKANVFLSPKVDEIKNYRLKRVNERYDQSGKKISVAELDFQIQIKVLNEPFRKGSVLSWVCREVEAKFDGQDQPLNDKLRKALKGLSLVYAVSENGEFEEVVNSEDFQKFFLISLEATAQNLKLPELEVGKLLKRYDSWVNVETFAMGDIKIFHSLYGMRRLEMNKEITNEDVFSLGLAGDKVPEMRLSRLTFVDANSDRFGLHIQRQIDRDKGKKALNDSMKALSDLLPSLRRSPPVTEYDRFSEIDCTFVGTSSWIERYQAKTTTLSAGITFLESVEFVLSP